jgi:hypothetical protein
MSALAKAVRRPKLKYTVIVLILLLWVAQAVYESYTYKSGTVPPLSRSVLESMFILEFLGRAIIFTFIAICLLRSWTYVFSGSDPGGGRRLLKLLKTVAIRIVITLIAINVWNALINLKPSNCEEYNRIMAKYMGGNVFEEGGRRYEMKVCSVLSLAPWFSGRVRLQLFSAENGELLAERTFWSSHDEWFQIPPKL